MRRRPWTEKIEVHQVRCLPMVLRLSIARTGTLARCPSMGQLVKPKGTHVLSATRETEVSAGHSSQAQLYHSRALRISSATCGEPRDSSILLGAGECPRWPLT